MSRRCDALPIGGLRHPQARRAAGRRHSRPLWRIGFLLPDGVRRYVRQGRGIWARLSRGRGRGPAKCRDRVGGVADAVLGDETGILVPPSVESISQAIAELAADRGLRAILAAGASARPRPSWERCAATTYGLFYAGNRTSVGRAIGTVA